MTDNDKPFTLTPQQLQVSSKGWWDDAFTRLLMDAIPFDIKQIVEVDCGMAASAHTLLPSFPDARYLGVDFTPQRLAEGKREMEQAAIAPRVELRLAPPDNIPLDDGAADIFLSIMMLQHNYNVPCVLAEAQRVLKTKGRTVIVEPDNLGQRFYFDGGLEEISNAFHSLCLKARVARQPSDIALGPRIPALLMEAGFRQIRMIAHQIYSSRMETAMNYFDRLTRIAHSIAEEAGLPLNLEQVVTCEQAIKRCLFSGLPKRLGFSCHLVPVFLCVSRKL